MSEARLMTFDLGPVEMARRLLGMELVRMIDGVRVSGRIVEVEAYLGAEDRAAHTFGGHRSARNESMYASGGHAYVYFTYGMHHCMNVVCGEEGVGVAVLIRALEPRCGMESMYERRRRATRARDLCSGPAKLCEALAIDRSLDGEHLLTSKRLWIEMPEDRVPPDEEIGRSPRIGVDYAGPWAMKPLRFFIRTSEHLSR